ncbi:alanine aminotransferase 1 [Eupeodes corollae]|uniref:alanine aminotransferase 1 n=1 Tax=Eupeodes corollae TaxID=290404 RepID=UPI00248FCD46|nr:alanine aminotransferase 1 [Eupeodes corollae]
MFLKNSGPTSTMANNVVRRWKSSFHHLKQQKQRQPLAAASLSQGGTSNVCGGASSASSSLPLKSSRLLTATSFTSLNSRLNYRSLTSAVNQITLNSTGLETKRKMSSKCLAVENINPNFITMEYAVRGPLVIRAGEIEKELAAGQKKPFTEVIRANIGDCHAMGQQPITHLRQMLALTCDKSLFNNPNIPQDVKDRALVCLKGCQGESIGSYSDSAGIEVIRRQVADYIRERDGIESCWENIYLSAGASPAIKSVLSLLNCGVDGKRPAILIPIPQYPLYSATLAEYDIGQIGYYLEESTNWGLDINELQRAVDEGKQTHSIRAIVIINPGNPTGQVLTRENIEAIIKFAHKEKLVLLADEVYQHNIYDKNSKFHSFKKVLMEMGAPYNTLELASFMSTSKGYLGECGIRGGYMELINFCPQVKAALTKSITASLCPTTVGQIAVSALVNPPKKGDESYDLYVKERDSVLGALAERAALVHEAFNSFEGFSCNVVQGAMYAFPQIKIPPKAIEAAKKKNMPADTFYAFELLEEAGICIVSGSGFKQQPGTYHFRTTILPQTEKLKEMLEKFQKFHVSFMNKYK